MQNHIKTLLIFPVLVYFLSTTNMAFAFWGDIVDRGDSVYGNALDYIFWIIIAFFLIVLFVNKLLDTRRKRSYSRFQDDFGEDFSGSTGGAPFGDGFKGLNRK